MPGGDHYPGNWTEAHSLPLIRRQSALERVLLNTSSSGRRQYKATADVAIPGLIVSQHALKCHPPDSVETHSLSAWLIATQVSRPLIVPSKYVPTHIPSSIVASYSMSWSTQLHWRNSKAWLSSGMEYKVDILNFPLLGLTKLL